MPEMSKLVCVNCGATEDVARLGDVNVCGACVGKLGTTVDGWRELTCPSCGRSTQVHEGERRAVHEQPECKWYLNEFIRGTGVPPYPEA